MICCWRILLEELLTIMAGVTVGSHGVCVQLKLGGGGVVGMRVVLKTRRLRRRTGRGGR